MKKKVLLLPSPPNSGSIGSSIKCLGIAKQLRMQGCECAIVIGGPLAELFKREGFKVYDFPVPKAKNNIEAIKNVVDFMQWTGMLDLEFINMAVQRELEAIKQFKPDVVFSETRPSTGISMQIEQVPYIAIISGPCQPDFVRNCTDIEEEQNKLFVKNIMKKYNLPLVKHPSELLTMGAKKLISPSIKELEPILANRKDICFTGHALNYLDDSDENDKEIDNWLEQQRGKKIIMVYLSVSAIGPSIFKQVIEETFRMSDISVICCCGNHYQLKRFNDYQRKNIYYSKYVPLSKLYRYVSLIIFHGGQDTMMFSLLKGIPSICFPGQHFERLYNAVNLEKLGVSKSCEIWSFRKSSLKCKIEEMLNTPTELLEHWSSVVRTQGGLEKCIDILLEEY